MKTILVRAPNWIGDQVLAYPFFHFLRRAYPRARIVVACVHWVESLQYRNLVDDVYALPRPDDRSLGARLRALEEGGRELRRRGPWDLGICLPNSLSSAWLLFRAGARVRRGYAADGRGLLLTSRVRLKLPAPTDGAVPRTHRSEDYIRLLPEGALGQGSAKELLAARHFWGEPPEDEDDPADTGTPGVLPAFDAARAWPGALALEPPKDPYWVLAPGSAAESRRWPLERFATLARQVAQERGLTGVVVGGAAEAPLAERLADDKELKLRNWTAQGTPADLWKLFRGAQFTVANDSGLAHVAALCGSRVYIVWGAGDPKRTEPLGPGRVVMTSNPVDCWPCERNTCALPPERKLECLRGISPEMVWEDMNRRFRRGSRDQVD